MRPHRFAWTGACRFTASAFDMADMKMSTNKMQRALPNAMQQTKKQSPFPATRLAWALCALLVAEPALASLTALPDDDMSNMHAQGLFWSDKITGTELVGANVYSTPFTFYRVGIDGELALNVNLGKLALGCGGVNDLLNATAGCDLDIDYATLMGRNAGNPGNPLSAFTMRRPYLELAIKNDGTANRELVGFKIGAENTDGAISAGRRYPNGAVNQETMPNTAVYGAGNDNCTGATGGLAPTDPNAIQCHGGINTISGAVGVELGLSLHLTATVLIITLNPWACAGRTTMTSDTCGTTRDEALFLELAGTRMQALNLSAVKLHLDLLGLDGYASVVLGLPLVHKLTFENSGDFSISFQREPVAYPRYSKMTPIAQMTANGTLATAIDACAYTQYAPARCNSAYSLPANTGWWLNAPNVKLTDVINENANLGNVSIGQLTALLAPPGLTVYQIEFNLTPAKNCYGATRFC